MKKRDKKNKHGEILVIIPIVISILVLLFGDGIFKFEESIIPVITNEKSGINEIKQAIDANNGNVFGYIDGVYN